MAIWPIILLIDLIGLCRKAFTFCLSHLRMRSSSAFFSFLVICLMSTLDIKMIKPILTLENFAINFAKKILLKL